MDKQQIKTFITLAQTLNFTKTAEELYITQPTVSRQIDNLEREWGIKLFLRTKRDVKLTEEGRIMESKCRQADAMIEAAIQEAQNYAKRRPCNVNIGVLEISDIEPLIMNAVDDLEANFENINVNIEKRSFSELRGRLLNEQLDLAFTLDFEANHLKNVEHALIAPLSSVFVISDRHPLWRKDCLNIADFDNQTFILPELTDSPGRLESLQGICSSLGIKERQVLFAPNLESVLFAIRNGKGVGVLDSSVKSIYESRYRFLPLPADKGPLHLVMAWKSGSNNPALPTVIRTFTKKASSQTYYANFE